jgi:hypothetical protein
MSERAVASPVNTSIQEGDVAISFSLHDMLLIGVGAIKLRQKAVHFFMFMGPDHECIINLP